MRILKGTESLAVDTNPLLSAIIGGNAKLVFLSAEGISFCTTLFNFREVGKYIPFSPLSVTSPSMTCTWRFRLFLSQCMTWSSTGAQSEKHKRYSAKETATPLIFLVSR